MVPGQSGKMEIDPYSTPHPRLHFGCIQALNVEDEAEIGRQQGITPAQLKYSVGPGKGQSLTKQGA